MTAEVLKNTKNTREISFKFTTYAIKFKFNNTKSIIKMIKKEMEK